jgi:hypothetical protein
VNGGRSVVVGEIMGRLAVRYGQETGVRCVYSRVVLCDHIPKGVTPSSTNSGAS